MSAAPKPEPAPGPPAGPTSVWKWLPGLQTARTYELGYLRNDLVAGLVLSALLVPAGMGYAEASGLPAIYGLYATIVPLLAYALFGPSRILVLGPDSSLAPLIAAAIIPLAAGDEARAVALAGALALFTGLVCIVAGLARFGFIADLLSKPVRYGYINGIALTVLVGQLPKLFGFSVESDQLPGRIGEFIQGLLQGESNTAATLIGLASLAVILACRRWAPRAPGVLIAVALSTVAVGALELAESGVSVVGEIPAGLPAFQLPSIGLSDVGPLLAAALGIFLVAFADTSVLSRTFAIRGGYRVDPDREVIGLGVANAAAGLFQGFPVSSSSSRTPVAESAGAKTQMTGVVGAAVIAVLLLFAPTLLKNLPTAALAAVVISAAISIAEIAGVRRLYRERRSEFILSIVTFLAVALLGVLPGMAVAVVLSLLNFVRRAWRPHDAVLGAAEGVAGFHDVTRYTGARQIPGLLIYRFDAPLFFANAERFGERVREITAASDTPVRWVVVEAEPITDVDTTAADMLLELHKDLEASGVCLAFAELKDPVKDRLNRYGLTDRIGHQHFFPTIDVAVETYLREAARQRVDEPQG